MLHNLEPVYSISLWLHNIINKETIYCASDKGEYKSRKLTCTFLLLHSLVRKHIMYKSNACQKQNL